MLRFMDKLETQKVFIKNDTLFTQAFLQKAEALIPMNTLQFRKPDEPVTSVLFLKDNTKAVLFYQGKYYEKVNPVAMMIFRIAFFGTLIISSFLIFFIPGLIVMLFRRKIKRSDFVARIIPLLAVLSFLVMSITFADLVQLRNIPESAFINQWTLIIFLLSLFFPVLSLTSLYFSVRNYNKTKSRFIKYYLLITSVGLCFLSVYMAMHGWLGMRIWQY